MSGIADIPKFVIISLLLKIFQAVLCLIAFAFAFITDDTWSVTTIIIFNCLLLSLVVLLIIEVFSSIFGCIEEESHEVVTFDIIFSILAALVLGSYNSYLIWPTYETPPDYILLSADLVKQLYGIPSCLVLMYIGCFIGIVFSYLYDPRWSFKMMIIQNGIMVFIMIIIIVEIIFSALGIVDIYSSFHQKYDIIFSTCMSLFLGCVTCYMIWPIQFYTPPLTIAFAVHLAAGAQYHPIKLTLFSIICLISLILSLVYDHHWRFKMMIIQNMLMVFTVIIIIIEIIIFGLGYDDIYSEFYQKYDIIFSSCISIFLGCITCYLVWPMHVLTPPIRISNAVIEASIHTWPIILTLFYIFCVIAFLATIVDSYLWYINVWIFYIVVLLVVIVILLIDIILSYLDKINIYSGCYTKYDIIFSMIASIVICGTASYLIPPGKSIHLIIIFIFCIIAFLFAAVVNYLWHFIYWTLFIILLLVVIVILIIDIILSSLDKIDSEFYDKYDIIFSIIASVVIGCFASYLVSPEITFHLIIIFICCLLAFICSNVYNSSWNGGAMIFLNIVLLVGVIVTIIEIVLSILGITQKYGDYHKKYDILFSMIISLILCGVISYLVLPVNVNISSLTATYVFSYFAVIVFAAHAIFKVIQYENY